jgi:integrase
MRGSIRKRGASSWRLVFDVSTADGKRKQRSVTVRGSYRDAQKELTRLLSSADSGTLPDPTRQTVGENLTAWLDGAHDLSPKTLERYRELAARQIMPHLGAIKLSSLKSAQVADWHGKLIAAGLSAQTVVHAHRILSFALKRAVSHNTVSRNVAAVVRPPKVEAQEVEILEPDQLALVMTGLEGHWLRPIARLALASGMRRGELLGLQWADIDLDRAIIRVERSVEETRAGLRIKPPKSKRGRRSLSVPSETVTMLREHRKWQIELRLAIGQGGQPLLVFSNVEGGLLSPDNLSRDWGRVCRQRRLPRVSFHSLRHTHASLLLAAGVPMLTVSRRLGHAKVSTTLDVYGHLMPGADADAAKAIEGVLK